MNQPLTMSAEQEAHCVEMLRGGVCGDRIMAELKATRAALDASEQQNQKLRHALNRLSSAVKRLGERGKDGRTLFEGSPANDPDCYAAFVELDGAQKEVGAAI